MTNLLTNARYVSGSLVLAMLVSGCASQAPQRDSGSAASQPSASPVASAAPSGERYAMSGDAYPVAPPDVSQVPDAEPRIEQPSRAGNRPTYEVWGETYRVLPDSRGYARQGTASWYGEKFHGYATSNGEIYDMYKMTAAHRSLPLPTFARVTSLTNGRSVIVRVNDRGPFHSDREIDLSYAAAARLGILDDGTGPVRVEAIDPAQWLAERGRGGEATRSTVASAPVPAASAPSIESAPAAPASSPSPAPAQASGDGIFLQIAALGTAEGAQQLQQRLSGELAHGVRVKSEAEVHRVQVGPVSPAQENQAREDLRRAGFPHVFIVR
jgi:rare lipoprotein A